jgi:hypothetical protein
MEIRAHVVLTVLLASVLLAASGCSQQRPSPAQHSVRALPFSVVATGDSGVDMRGATTFAWSRSLQPDSPGASPENRRVETLLQDAIIATLQGKGYRYSEVPGEGDLIVGYQVALDEPGADRELPQTGSDALQPSLNLVSPEPGKYEKGTLSIEVTEKQTGLTAWRSVLQGFANLQLSDAERRQRIGLMVDRMLAGVPAR